MKAILGLALGLLLSLSLAAFAGENPWTVFLILSKSAFGSSYDLGLALFYTTSFVFTGLAVSLAFHAGLFNIGAEGQLTVATLAAAWLGITYSEMPSAIAPFLISVFAVSVGALWGLIPGWLRAYRGSHEVIVTMMMNFIAAGIASYVTLEVIKNTNTQNPESQALPSEFLFASFDFVQKFFADSPANLSLVIAIILSLLCYFFLYHTVWGFEIRASGQNEKAAQIAGIHSKRMVVLAMTLAGAAAGFVALNEVLGSSGRYRMGFSADYGFVGIAVALLARNHPIGILASAFLFGILQKGASDLDVETEFITRDFARIIQAILIFSVAGVYFLDFRKWRKKPL